MQKLLVVPLVDASSDEVVRPDDLRVLELSDLVGPELRESLRRSSRHIDQCVAFSFGGVLGAWYALQAVQVVAHLPW